MNRPRAATDKRSHRDCGAALVEFAMILPILVLLVFGVIEFGRAYHAKSTMAHAARQGVRAAALDSGDPVAATEQASSNLDPSQLTVAIDPDPCSAGDPVTVTVTYDHEYAIPLWGTGTWTFHESAVMRCEG